MKPTELENLLIELEKTIATTTSPFILKRARELLRELRGEAPEAVTGAWSIRARRV